METDKPAESGFPKLRALGQTTEKLVGIGKIPGATGLTEKPCRP